jgi:uncharacterized repeat protein (TIGR01451 family)
LLLGFCPCSYGVTSALLGPLPPITGLRYDGRNVLRIALAALVLFVSVLAFACDGDGDDAPTPEGPTTLSLEKAMVETGDGQFRFTLTLTNAGDNAALNVDTSDNWQEGLEAESIGSVEGQQPKAIGSTGFEFILKEFAAGKSVEVVYTARCIETGEWENTAVTTSANSDASETAVTVVCP